MGCQSESKFVVRRLFTDNSSLLEKETRTEDDSRGKNTPQRPNRTAARQLAYGFEARTQHQLSSSRQKGEYIHVVKGVFRQWETVLPHNEGHDSTMNVGSVINDKKTKKVKREKNLAPQFHAHQQNRLLIAALLKELQHSLWATTSWKVLPPAIQQPTGLDRRGLREAVVHNTKKRKRLRGVL